MANPPGDGDGSRNNGFPDDYIPDPGATLREIRVKDLLDEVEVQKQGEDYPPLFEEPPRPRARFNEPSRASPLVILLVLFAVTVLVFVGTLALAILIGGT